MPNKTKNFLRNVSFRNSCRIYCSSISRCCYIYLSSILIRNSPKSTFINFCRISLSKFFRSSFRDSGRNSFNNCSRSCFKYSSNMFSGNASTNCSKSFCRFFWGVFFLFLEILPRRQKFFQICFQKLLHTYHQEFLNELL